MKKLFVSLIVAGALFVSIYPCGKSFNLNKVSYILENIVRRVEKNPFDYLDQEISSTINLFHAEFNQACLSCRYSAERQCMHLIEYLKRHMIRYKKLVITAL